VCVCVCVALSSGQVFDIVANLGAETAILNVHHRKYYRSTVTYHRTAACDKYNIRTETKMAVTAVLDIEKIMLLSNRWSDLHQM